MQLCVASLLPFSFVGCGATSLGVEEHHHHVRRRQTFAEAVSEIQSRSVRFTSGDVSNDAELLKWKKQKLLEIVRQLPVLAADSDLRKKAWDQVNVTTKELLKILQPEGVVSNDGPIVEHARFLELIVALQQAASSTETAEF